MSATAAHRYKGTSPFQDSALDRKTFFGRDYEARSLLSLVLSEDLVLLFAKSGMGKSSLLNAGLLPQLRQRKLIPLVVRINDTRRGPLGALFDGARAAAAQAGIDCLNGDETSAWHFFKTLELWSQEDELLQPVLIIDQFEELFTLHPPERRHEFARGLAELVRGRSAIDAASGDRSPPRLKIVLSFREEFLADLEELTRHVPGLLRNRFRLGPLSREGARAAILEPARLDDTAFASVPFTFRQEAVERMITFLGRHRLGKETITTDEVEPVQLQLICQYVEEQVRQRQSSQPVGIEISDADLGGEEHLQRVLESYYARIIDGLGSRAQIRRVRRLCETRLISPSGRRLTEDEEEIETRFGIAKERLQALVERRLLRAERRLGGTFYELSHDTLIAPILSSRNKRLAKRRALAATIGVATLVALALTALGWRQSLKHYEGQLLQQAATSEAQLMESHKAITELKLESFGNLAGDGVDDGSTGPDDPGNEPDRPQARSVDERLQADRERQALLDRRRPQELEAKVVVRYYAKSADGLKVAAALSETFEVVPGDAKLEQATNYIGFGGAVSLDDVRLVAYTLMRAGVEIKAIWPFPPDKIDDPGFAHQIHVATITRPEVLARSPWTVDEVRDTTSFTREP